MTAVLLIRRGLRLRYFSNVIHSRGQCNVSLFVMGLGLAYVSPRRRLGLGRARTDCGGTVKKDSNKSSVSLRIELASQLTQ